MLFTKPKTKIIEDNGLESEVQENLMNYLKQVDNQRVLWMKDVIKSYEAMRRIAQLPRMNSSSRGMKRILEEKYYMQRHTVVLLFLKLYYLTHRKLNGQQMKIM